jgi:hypothetical protein
MIALLLALAAAEPTTAPGFGVGSYSCAKAHRTENSEAAFTWVKDYIAGGDVAVRGARGSKADRVVIMGRIKLACDGDPTLNLTTAAELAYGELLQLLRPVAKPSL